MIRILLITIFYSIIINQVTPAFIRGAEEVLTPRSVTLDKLSQYN